VPIQLKETPSLWLYFWFDNVPKLSQRLLKEALKERGFDNPGAPRKGSDGFCERVEAKRVSHPDRLCRQALDECGLPHKHLSTETVWRFFYQVAWPYSREDLNRCLSYVPEKDIIKNSNYFTKTVMIETKSEPSKRFLADVREALALL